MESLIFPFFAGKMFTIFLMNSPTLACDECAPSCDDSWVSWWWSPRCSPPWTWCSWNMFLRSINIIYSSESWIIRFHYSILRHSWERREQWAGQIIREEKVMKFWPTLMELSYNWVMQLINMETVLSFESFKEPFIFKGLNFLGHNKEK